MTDRDALLANILAAPGDDLARLVYADWLDENPGAVACGRCKGTGFRPGGKWESDYRMRCPDCSGSGTVSAGDRERAEFIRLQVELAAACRDGEARSRTPAGCCSRHADYLACDCLDGPPGLRQKSRAMLERWRAVWFPGVLAQPAAGVPIWGDPDDSRFAVARIDRGFAAEARFDLRHLLSRGPALIGSNPVTAVTLTDRWPWAGSWGTIATAVDIWGWWAPDDWADNDRGHIIPREILAHIPADAPGRRDTPQDVRPGSPGGCVVFDSAAGAWAGLSEACIAWARSGVTAPVVS